MVARCLTSVPISEPDIKSLREWEHHAYKTQMASNQMPQAFTPLMAKGAVDSYFAWLEKTCEYYTPENWRERNPLDYRRAVR